MSIKNNCFHHYFHFFINVFSVLITSLELKRWKLTQKEFDESVLNTSTQNIFSKDKSIKTVLEQYKDIPKQKLDLLVKRYARDMEILGYHFNPETFEATCAIDTPDGVCC